MSRKPELRGRAARLARLIPAGGGSGAARTPFVLLVVALLGGGLIGLLVLNSALSEGAFKVDDLQRQTKSLTDEEQALQRDVDAYSAPDALQRRARELGMVPGGDPAFLGPGGTVKGEPQAAAQQSSVSGWALRPPEVLDPYPSPKGSPLPSPAQSPSPSPAQSRSPSSSPSQRQSPSRSAPTAARASAPPSTPPAHPSATHGR